jgi:chromate reductase, NAD(P)H dehydrogenase (quinone)
METKLKILGFAGSLRVGSYNKALLRAATELLPDDATLEIFDLDGIPPFNQDLEMTEAIKAGKVMGLRTLGKYTNDTGAN